MSKVYFAFNLWTSRNLLSLNGIVAHFLNKDFKARCILLLTLEQLGSHAGINIADRVSKVINDFKIINKIRFFILDNASNNDIAVDALAETYSFDAI